VFGKRKQPGDKSDHVLPQDPDSRTLTTAEVTGDYVYVVDEQDEVHVLPQRNHGHPVVLGSGLPGLYAGELSIDLPGSIGEVNNLSGSFRFRSKRSLCCLAERLRVLGFRVGELVWYPPDGSSRPARLSCDPMRGYS